MAKVLNDSSGWSGFMTADHVGIESRAVVVSCFAVAPLCTQRLPSFT